MCRHNLELELQAPGLQAPEPTQQRATHGIAVPRHKCLRNEPGPLQLAMATTGSSSSPARRYGWVSAVFTRVQRSSLGLVPVLCATGGACGSRDAWHGRVRCMCRWVTGAQCTRMTVCCCVAVCVHVSCTFRLDGSGSDGSVGDLQSTSSLGAPASAGSPFDMDALHFNRYLSPFSAVSVPGRSTHAPSRGRVGSDASSGSFPAPAPAATAAARQYAAYMQAGTQVPFPSAPTAGTAPRDTPLDRADADAMGPAAASRVLVPGMTANHDVGVPQRRSERRRHGNGHRPRPQAHRLPARRHTSHPNASRGDGGTTRVLHAPGIASRRRPVHGMAMGLSATASFRARSRKAPVPKLAAARRSPRDGGAPTRTRGGGGTTHVVQGHGRGGARAKGRRRGGGKALGRITVLSADATKQFRAVAMEEQRRRTKGNRAAAPPLSPRHHGTPRAVAEARKPAAVFLVGTDGVAMANSPPTRQGGKPREWRSRDDAGGVSRNASKRDQAAPPMQHRERGGFARPDGGGSVPVMLFEPAE